MPFEAGKSGNPNGRPKKGKAMADALRVALSKSTDGKQNKRAIAEKLVEMARDGNIEAMKIVFERTDGKVPQTNVVQGDEDGGPVTVRVVYDEPSGA